MLATKIGSAFDAHRPAGVDVRGGDIALGEAEAREDVEAAVGECIVVETQHVAAEGIAQSVAVEGETDVEGRGDRLVDPLQRRLVEAARGEAPMIDGRRRLE